MEPPVHKTVFIAPRKKRPVTGHGKNKTLGAQTNASVIRRIHSYDIVTRVHDDDIDVCTGSPSSLSFQNQVVATSTSLVPLVDHSQQEIRQTDLITDVDKDPDTSVELQETIKLTGDTTVVEGAKSEHQDDQVSSSDNYLTLTGTLKRGKRDGKSIGVTLNMSREELEKIKDELTKNAEPTLKGHFLFGVNSGLHVFVFSLLAMPIVMFVSTVYAFYYGTFTWYNVYLHFSEERDAWHRVIVCPVLVLTYPFWVAPVAIGVGLYAAFMQVSWRYDRWHAEVQDLEKGFFGWICAMLNLVDCAPYQVVVLTDNLAEVDAEKTNPKSSDIETTTV